MFWMNKKRQLSSLTWITLPKSSSYLKMLCNVYNAIVNVTTSQQHINTKITATEEKRYSCQKCDLNPHLQERLQPDHRALGHSAVLTLLSYCEPCHTSGERTMQPVCRGISCGRWKGQANLNYCFDSKTQNNCAVYA